MRLAANGAQRKRPHPEKGQGHVFGRSGNAESRATPGRERGGWAMSCVCVCVCGGKFLMRNNTTINRRCLLMVVLMTAHNSLLSFGDLGDATNNQKLFVLVNNCH